MGLPEDFVNPTLGCQNIDFQWPAINAPGLPSFLVATLAGQLAGINYLLSFLPPDPGNLPTPPSLTIFIDPFLAGLVIPGDLGEIDFGGGIVIPATGTDIQFNQSGLINLILVCVKLPFQIIIGIIDKIISDLIVAIPSVEDIEQIFFDLAVSVGLSGLAVAKLGGCLAQSLFDLLTSLIPV